MKIKNLQSIIRFFCYFRCVIDCTEFEIESTTNYTCQGNIFSQYKHRTTAKVLIATNPNGAAIFVSDAFEGCITDPSIVQKSGFLNFIEEGDLVLADRGFGSIDEMLARKKGNLLMPAFLKGRDKLPVDEEAETKIIARAIRFNVLNWCAKRGKSAHG